MAFIHSLTVRKSLCACWLTLFGILLSIESVNSEHAAPSDIYLSALQPLPPLPELDMEKVRLGEQLFNDPILSGNRSMSCASCHDLRRGGDDNRQFSVNTLNELRTLNTPTVFNVNHNFKISIAGAVDSLEQFYRVNLFSKKAMNNDWDVLVTLLGGVPTYSQLFASAYPDGITPDNVVDALLAFQSSLVTTDSRFDRYLRGDHTAITPQQKRGYNLFRSYGCVACHQGKNVGGNLYQKFGLFEDYYSSVGRKPRPADFGLFNKTKREKDKFFFRVPGLRNVAVTAPYLHDGSIETLDEAIRIMGKYQLGRDIDSSDRNDIAAFLSSLTGSYKGRPLEN